MKDISLFKRMSQTPEKNEAFSEGTVSGANHVTSSLGRFVIALVVSARKARGAGGGGSGALRTLKTM